MNDEFKKHLDEIRDYVGGVAPEARAVLMQALVEKLLSEFQSGRFPDRSNVFRYPPPSAPAKASETSPQA